MAAARMRIGKGIAKKKMPMNANAAMAICARLRKARAPTRNTAATTMASTAAFKPENSACTMPICP